MVGKLAVPLLALALVPAACSGNGQESGGGGDIPDNQVFLGFRNASAGYMLKYPEGWTRLGSGKVVAFREKDNFVRIVIRRGAPPTPASVKRELASLPGATVKSGPDAVKVSGAPAIKVVYTATSGLNPVTGKRPKLVVDRYYVSRANRTAVVDLGTPVGVDNVDAYRLMIESFRWR